jgi:tRNA-2-methylthio-N6-dimethylallyladenosine synthase
MRMKNAIGYNRRMKYHIWTEGCQMNFADSHVVAEALQVLGYEPVGVAEQADIIVLNTCVVRQSAEDKAYGRLSSLKSYKLQRPDVVINLMGCLVGINGDPALRKRFPYVDVFSPPSDPRPLIDFMDYRESRLRICEPGRMDGYEQDIPVSSFRVKTASRVSALVPIVLGCSHACTYCVIPSRRGAERSRPAQEILREVKEAVANGVKEITLLGQIVDRYGKDLSGKEDLASLMQRLSDIQGLERIRFLTSHPFWMTEELLNIVASSPIIMPHIEVPVQAGDDEILRRMRRGYSVAQYRVLIERIRAIIPGVSIGTDVIVGFPGETDVQFQYTSDLLKELRFDVVHLARYSPRPGTYAAEHLVDDVPDGVKWQRFRQLEELQTVIATEINARLQGTITSVLFEGKSRSRWRGRTPNNKLVFVDSQAELGGRTKPVKIHWTGPWSLLGEIMD